MKRGTQQADWLSSAIYRAMLWLFAVVVLGEVHANAAGAGVARDSAGTEITLQFADGRDGALWVTDSSTAVLPGDQEDNGVPAPDLAEAGGDGFALSETHIYRWSSHRLALGVQTYPSFTDRPEAGASHARAPPSILLSA